MLRPPRRPEERLFSPALIRAGLLQGLLALGVVGLITVGAGQMGLAPDRGRTLSFFALLAAIMALVLANRSFSSRLGHAFMRRNTAFRYVVAFILAGCTVILSFAPIRRTLGFAVPNPLDVAAILLSGFALLILFELGKRLEKW